MAIFWTQKQDIGPAPRWGHGMAYRGQAGKAMLFGGSTVFAPAQDANLKPGLLLDTWELPLAISQPDVGPTTGVDVATVVLQPNTASAMGDAIQVFVNLTGPTPVDAQLVWGIFADDGSGGYQPVQPPGFDFPPPITVLAGGSKAQFQIVRNGDSLALGNYALGVGVQGGTGMQAGFFTVA